MCNEKHYFLIMLLALFISMTPTNIRLIDITHYDPYTYNNFHSTKETKSDSLVW